MKGQYVPLKETIRGFKKILDGECDDIPESCFLFAGTIDDVYENANSSSRREEQVYDDLPFTDRDHGRKCI